MHHLALRVGDLEAARRFWQEDVGLPYVSEQLDEAGGVRAIWLALGHGALLMLERASGRRQGLPSDAGGFVLALAIRLGERAERLEALAARGVKVVHQTSFTFYVEDSEGNRLGFSHYPYARPDAPAAPGPGRPLPAPR